MALQWIGAHLLAQLVCIATVSAGYGLAKLFGIATPNSARTFLSAAFVIGVVTELIYVAASAWLRGAVLQQVLPRFRMLPWLAVVGGYMLAMALLSGFSTVMPADGTRKVTEVTADFLMKGLITSTVMGAIFGLLVGSLEALVIRRTSSLLLVKAAPMSATMIVAVGFAMKITSALIIAVLTLPAVLYITPRMIEPVPLQA